jgi:hypothetical protein
MNRHLFPAAVFFGSLVSSVACAADDPPPKTIEELWRIIQAQQAEIEALKNQQKATTEKAQAADEKAEAAVVAIEETSRKPASAASWADRTHIGSYGEMHYRNWNGKGGASNEDQIDFTRFVLSLGHQFTDRLRLFTEVELEHAFVEGGEEDEDGAPGELELEQAYIEYDLTPSQHLRGGIFLIPVGILNETHEPTTFYGVIRNPVETNIIPTTWWAGGVEALGEIAPGWSYAAAFSEGLKTDAEDDYAIRAGRQKTAEADAKDPAYTARIKWTGIPGIEMGGTVQYQSNISQSTDPDAGSAWLYSAHGIYASDHFGLRALYAYWDLNGSGPKSLGADIQKGWYIEPAWRFNDKLGIFARYNQWDNLAGSDSGAAHNSKKRQWNAGVNWWPYPNVVLKADYQNQNNADGVEQDGLNLGIGYAF